jgi:7-cyano-7-deazaguanine synthase in queuosine biosynthesis
LRYNHDISGAPSTAANEAQAIELNCRLIGSVAVEVEKRARTEPIDEVQIPLYGLSGLGYGAKRLATLLEDLFLYVLARQIEITFAARPVQQTLVTQQNRDHFDAVCLFSGGVDSYCGILHATRHYRKVVGAFCAHSDQARVIRIVRSLQRRLKAHGVRAVEELRVPALGARGYIQLRGFLYVVTAGSVLHASGATNLLVTEIGPTMFQPRFSLLDSITMTTHPEVLRLARECLNILLDRTIDIITPHSNMTKAEVMARCPDKSGLRKTHSCISQRFGNHDGTCYGCVVRRLASTAADIEDTRYSRNPIWDESATGGNLMELLRFSTNLIANPQSLQEFQRQHISQFNVNELFRRFALDNLAALHRIRKRGGRLRMSIRRMMDEVDRSGRLNEVEARIEHLDNMSAER